MFRLLIRRQLKYLKHYVTLKMLPCCIIEVLGAYYKVTKIMCTSTLQMTKVKQKLNHGDGSRLQGSS